METYANALLYAIPFFILLLVVEISYGYFIKKQMHKTLDTVSSISSGLTNIIKDSLGLAFIVVSYPFLLEHLALTEIKATWLVWVIAFVVMDFAGYWNHRLSHRVNIFWNQHVIHHSSEEFNLACALRQPISNLIGYFSILLLPAALLGVPYEVIAILAPVHLFAQFWYHTKHIGKMGWVEKVLVTPSQHRVHHAINPEYIDKNLGQILCIWDRMFGTFQEELDDVPPQFGILKQAATWNPVHINFQHFWNMLKDAWRTKKYGDKLRIWFMPTGWRPKDVQEKYPMTIIEDVYQFKRYDTVASRSLKAYVIFQMLFSVLLLMYMFYSYSDIGFDGLLWFGAFVFVGIYGYSSLMDRSKIAVYVEMGRGLLGLGTMYYLGDWFGLDSFLPFGNVVMVVYFLITIFCGIYFTFLEGEGSETQVMA
ncbi:sterol desaturase family protein [Sediminicola sp. 1XM1-17]|uniref:sterol desaturase family protein n=1 Tax=Sediminicola sp. 1XM1-17 TaxID=3127702 RepID=UPI0030778C9A